MPKTVLAYSTGIVYSVDILFLYRMFHVKQWLRENGASTAPHLYKWNQSVWQS